MKKLGLIGAILFAGSMMTACSKKKDTDTPATTPANPCAPAANPCNPCGTAPTNPCAAPTTPPANP